MKGSAGQKRVPEDYIKNYKLSAPMLKDQIQIVHFLDKELEKIDTLIKKKEQLITLLEEKRKAVISHAVTKGLNPKTLMKDSGVEWLGSVPVHWDIMPLRYFIRTTKGFAFKSTDFRDEGVRVVRATDIKQKTILKSAVFLPKEFLGTHHKVRLTTGDIIISTVGSNPDVINSAVGQIGMVPEELNNTLLNQNTVILKPTKRVSNNFLIHLLSSTAYRENLDLYAHGTANQSSLSLEDILNYKSAIPPIEEQEIIYAEINKKVSLIEKLIKKSNCSIKLSRERRTALISAAVTGKIDIREEVAHAVI